MAVTNQKTKGEELTNQGKGKVLPIGKKEEIKKETNKSEGGEKVSNNTKIETVKKDVGNKQSETKDALTQQNISEGELNEALKNAEDTNGEGKKGKSGTVNAKVKGQKTNKNEEEEKEKEEPFVRLTQLQDSRLDWTIKRMVRENKAHKLNFKLAIQRGEAWTDEQKSNLIHSILYGFPIPNMYCEASKELDEGKTKDVLHFLDGKQRMSSILQYVNGEFKLVKNTPDVFGRKIAGKYFDELSEEMQDMILEKQISIIKMEHMTEAERDLMFVRLNSGTPLSQIALTRSMHSKMITHIKDLSSLEFFATDIYLTKKEREDYVHQNIIIQIAMLLDLGVEKIKGLSAKDIREYVLSLKEEGIGFREEIQKEIETISAYMSMASGEFIKDEIKQALKKSKVPTAFVVGKKAMELGLKPREYGQFMLSFLVNNYTKESVFGKVLQSSSTKKLNVKTAIEEMTKYLEMFAEKVKGADNTTKAIEEFDKFLSKEIEKQVQVNTQQV